MVNLIQQEKKKLMTLISKMKMCLFISVLISTLACTGSIDKVSSVEGYLQNGIYSPLVMINDTTVIYDSQEEVFLIRHGDKEQKLYSREKYDSLNSVNFPERFESDAVLAIGSKIFDFRCYQCHSKKIIKTTPSLDINYMYDYFKEEIPKIRELAGKEYYRFGTHNNHSDYFLLTTDQKNMLFKFIDCERNMQSGCDIILSRKDPNRGG